ncbi:Bicyclomycin resistance protein [Methyloligella halotolerans]|uniref:Bcr/CflA family efflux transporter n=1 Tax=Methyloligella halotolerans TaxID=1177755 RepID=A0A1E2RX11_9HYPH|nr:multidrug effflux MFS transporter [Methyloligella halotolerans]ODA66692.1 Bicyclomycin resistance protein [Methyloligella halotolerans]
MKQVTSDGVETAPPVTPAVPSRRTEEKPSNSGMGFAEFVALMAALMATNALSIDAMLPVLGEIGKALHIVSENDRQWVVTAYLLGFGGAQLIYGPLADRYGRKSVLMVGLAIYVVFSAATAFATSLSTMILIRFLQGCGAAGTRVLSITIIRDCYSGRHMARVMSLAFIVFLSAPILAPSFGYAIASVAPWQWIFGALALFGVLVSIWTWVRLKETLHPADQIPISPRGIGNALEAVITNRMALGYTFAMALMLGALFSFITSAQQVFAEALHEPDLFPFVFALAAGGMAVASFVNSRIVERMGTRRVSHFALLGFIAIAALHGVVAWTGHENVWTFAALQAGLMFCFGLIGPNFNSMAMEPLGHIAGTGSAVVGFTTTVVGAVIGFLVGQQFDGTLVPLTFGFLGCGLAALVLVYVTEQGRMFLPRTKSA